MNDSVGEDSFGGAPSGDDAELYLLKWNSHQNHFANKFSELLDEDDISFADVTLACEGHFLQAHRLVLSVCSTFFKNLFKVNCAEKGPATIVLANVRYTDLENILHFIYRGQVNVRKEDLNKFLETGDQLQIDGLMGQNSQSKPNNGFKRRYSEGGSGQLGSSRPSSQTSQGPFLNRNRSTIKTVQGTPKPASGNVVRPSESTSQNHVDSQVKRARFSPPSTTTLSAKQDTASTIGNSSPLRRISTSATVVHVNNSTSPIKSDSKDAGNSEASENNGIKIVNVATGNNASPADEPEIFEVLDYDEDDDDRAENEIELSEDLIATYGDGEDGMYYTYVQSSQNLSSQSVGQQSRLSGSVHARYPSIIDGVHFDLISADDNKVAAQCKLCPGEKVIRGSGLTSSNFISHLRAFHKRELEEWREKRKSETRRRMDSKDGVCSNTVIFR